MNLKEQRSPALRSATGILDAATAAGRELTAPEQQTVEGLFTQVEERRGKIDGPRRATTSCRRSPGGPFRGIVRDLREGPDTRREPAPVLR